MLTANRVCITLITLILFPFHLSASNLGVSEKYNGFFLETFTATSSRIEGRLATGDTIKVAGYSFGDQLVPENAGTVVITGGNLDYRDGRIYFGSAVAAGNIDKVGNGVLHGMAEGQSVLGNQTLPFNFEEQFVHLRDVSSRLSQSPANGTSEYKWGGMYLKGDCEAPLQIFNLTGSQVLSAHTFEVTCIPDDATVIFNISGESAGFKNFSLANLIPHRTKTIYNFYQATELILNGMEVEGSVLAPYAHINDPRGTTNGTVIAKSWNGQMHLHHFPFSGDLGFLSNPPEIISPAVFYTDEKVSYDYDVEAIDPDSNEVLTYSLDKAPQGMNIDAQTGQISWLADDSYTASNAKFNKQCYIVPEGAIEVVQEGDDPKSGRNYIAPLFLGVKEAIKNAGNFVAPEAIAWDKKNKCLGCHVQTQSLVGLATSKDKADVDKEAINYLLTALMSSQQANGAIYNHEPHKVYSVIQTALAVWSLSDGLDPTDTFAVRSNALNFLWSRKQGSSQASWAPEHQTGWSRTDTSITAIVALSASRYLSDAQTQPLTSAQQETVDKWQSLIPNIAEYFLASYKNVNDGNLINALRLVGLSELRTHVQDATLLERIEIAQQYLNDELRKKQMNSGGWDYLSNGKSDPMISAWVGIALNYLQPALTDSAVLKNITYLLDSQAANGTWNTPSLLFKDTDFGATSLVMSYLPVALEHLGNPDLRVSDVILSEQEEQPHTLSATISNRGLGDVITPIIVEFYNDKDELLGSSNLNDLRSAVNQTVSINVNEENLTKDVFVRLTVGKDVEECLIGNNEVKAAIVKARVTDLYGNFDTQIFSVNVNDVNEAPVITSQPDIEHHQGQEYLYQVQVTDTDIGDAAKFVLIAPPAGLYIDERTGQIFSNSDQLLPGEYTITVEVSDLAGLTVEQTFTLTVKENLPPVITSPAVETGLEKAGYHYQVTATDPNPNDTLSYGLELSDNAMSINKQTGLINWQADSGLVEPLISDNGLCEAPANVIADFKVVKKWSWSHSNASLRDVYGPVVVGQLTDDNSDGLINDEDNTDILFFSGKYTQNQTLRVVDGATGAEKLAIPFEFSLVSSPAIADVDGDLRPEIVVVGKYRKKLFLLEDDGTVVWEATIPNLYSSHTPRDGISIADLDSDGNPEIILGNLVYNNAGELLWKGGFDTGGEASYGIVSVVEDIDLDGNYEVLAGRTVYRHDGSVFWNRNDLVGSGFNAVANFDSDDEAEVVLVSNSKVYLLDTDGSTIWGPVNLPGGGFGGAPTIADIDSDGIPEIAIAGANYYSVFNAQGKVLWSRKTIDASSNRTGSSFFDFEGDGKSEILYADEKNFYIYEGLTGNVIYQRANISGTVLEYPVVADVDNDGHAEIVLGENGSSTAGIKVFEGFPEWVPTRRVWNQYSYSINNINDDLSVPLVPTHPWLSHNTFRLNTFLDRPALAQADLVVHSIRYDASAGAISATVKNRGLATSSATTVDFFHEHGLTGDTKLGSTNVVAIEAGQEIEININTTVDDADITEMIRSVINDGNVATECNYDNNISYASITKVRVYDEGKLWDKQKFSVSIKNENDAPVISNLKTSNGSQGSEYTFQVTVNDPDVGDAFIYQLASNNENFIINQKTGEISASNLTPGVYDLTIRVTDLAGVQAIQDHLVTISEAGNTPPYYITHPDLQTKVEDDYQYQVEAVDEDNDSLHYILSQAPEGMSIDSQTGLLQWTPTKYQIGEHQVNITTVDANNASVSQSFTLNVADPNASNVAPTIVSAPRGSINVGKQFEYQLIVEDDQPQKELTYGIENSVAGMTISSNGLFTWLPTSVQANQTFTIIVHVDDGRGGFNSQQLSLPVNQPANSPAKILSSPIKSATQNVAFQYLMMIEDAEGDSWTIELTESPIGMALTGNLLTWTPTSKQIAQSHPVKLTVTDARGSVSSQEFKLWVNSAVTGNQPPLLTNTPNSPAIIGSLFQHQLSVTDPDGELVTLTIEKAPLGLSIDDNFAVHWTPSASQLGSHPIEVSLTDGNYIEKQSFTINVVTPSKSNSAPEITSQPSGLAIVEKEYLYQLAITDPDNDPITSSVTQGPTGMVIDSDHKLKWTPTSSDVGQHNIIIQVSDGRVLLTHSYILTVALANSINHPPSFTSMPGMEQSTLAVGRELSFKISASDPDGDALQYSLELEADNAIGLAIDANTGLLTAFPFADDQVATYNYKVTVTDDKGASTWFTYALQVLATGSNNHPPKFISQPNTIAKVGENFSYQLNATDSDGDMLTYKQLSGPLQLDNNGLLTWQPENADIGEYPVEVTVSDSYGATATQKFTLYVLATNDNLPVFISSPNTKLRLEEGEYQYQAKAINASGEALIYKLVNAPASMTIDTTSGLIKWQANPTQLGSHSIQLKAINKNGQETDQMYSLQVSNTGPWNRRMCR